jgi:tetratricopeptide (TPR) repeat protein
MKSNLPTRFFTLLRLLLACLVLSSVTPVWAADYDSLVSQSREQIENEQYTEALATAKEAVSKKPNDYKGHYYAAMAYMSLGQFDEADAEVATALNQAPKSAKPAVEKLVSAIKDGRKGSDQGAGKEIILSCTGITILESGKVGGNKKSTTMNRRLIFKIKDNSIQRWRPGIEPLPDQWEDNMCNKKSSKCGFNDASFTYALKSTTKSSGDTIDIDETWVINRVRLSK